MCKAVGETCTVGRTTARAAQKLRLQGFQDGHADVEGQRTLLEVSNATVGADDLRDLVYDRHRGEHPAATAETA